MESVTAIPANESGGAIWKMDSYAKRAVAETLADEVIVLRGGTFKTILARKLAPGDILKLRIGNITPAGMLLFQGDYLQVEQALTGESLPANKTANEAAYTKHYREAGRDAGDCGQYRNPHQLPAMGRF